MHQAHIFHKYSQFAPIEFEMKLMRINMFENGIHGMERERERCEMCIECTADGMRLLR